MKNRIAKIYDLLSQIPVTGGNVDIMAVARQELRDVHKALLAQEAQEAQESQKPEEVTGDG